MLVWLDRHEQQWPCSGLLPSNSVPHSGPHPALYHVATPLLPGWRPPASHVLNREPCVDSGGRSHVFTQAAAHALQSRSPLSLRLDRPPPARALLRSRRHCHRHRRRRRRSHVRLRWNRCCRCPVAARWNPGRCAVPDVNLGHGIPTPSRLAARCCAAHPRSRACLRAAGLHGALHTTARALLVPSQRRRQRWGSHGCLRAALPALCRRACQ
mmetsp:Transcript_33162/g.98724  ORF Transcript_33162/g.98724 Transcript_33162/m.98724 type:complete len:212 (-) Transcript_33162:292-927(-)